jgi:ABC-type glutathione transport system ATPase component
MNVLDVEDLTVTAPDGTRLLDRVSLSIAQGETLGLVGASGAGKSMLALALLGLVRAPLAVTATRLRIAGNEMAAAREADWQRLRGADVALVFQDSAASLNPVRTIGSLLVETIRRRQRLPRDAARARAAEGLRAVGLQPAQLDAYPHRLSGGMRQRAMLALALANRPRLLVADEPTTALDATIQLQILELLRREAQTRALLLITHDPDVAAEMCSRIATLDRGRLHG